ncbi:hypothetical protein C8T65DRAFT_588550 [Cerioporus squamosus]|nr:hypothetical protein C8T65DRAFT_588550 [Cerioporus squamosus]
MRDVYLSHIRKQFPRFEPRHDYDILSLGDGRYQGSEDGIYSWLDQELALQVALLGDARPAIEGARRALSVEGVVTGLKPAPGDPNVFIRPIPHSRYAIRLFPGARVMREYCLDFVTTTTGQPVNSPFEFELWSVGTSSSRHIGGSVRLRSLESCWGYSSRDILPGEEKFVLTDGMVCLLKRPGHKPVRFRVPTRLDHSDRSDVDELDLPRVVA